MSRDDPNYDGDSWWVARLKRAERIEEAARALLEKDGDPYPGHVRGCSCMDCEAVGVSLRFALESALSQPREPTPSPDDEVRGPPCACGSVRNLDEDGCCRTCGIDWNYELAVWQDGHRDGYRDGVGRLIRVLKKCEWVEGQCPICRRWRPGSHGERAVRKKLEGHAPGCWVATALQPPHGRGDDRFAPREPTPSPAATTTVWYPVTDATLALCPEHAIRLPCPACLPAAPPPKGT